MPGAGALEGLKVRYNTMVSFNNQHMHWLTSDTFLT